MHKPFSAANTAALYFTQRLTNALEVASTRPLTLVEAPMGYGKTVAVREYLHKRMTRTVWTLVLSAGEDVFWRDFCRALAQAFPKNTDVVESLTRVGYPCDSVLVNVARELLLQLDFGPETVLVIDDIHLLPDSGPGGGMVGLCSLLARQDLKNLRLMLISRDTWPGDGGSGREILALKGQLAAIDCETLALNTVEIREYYALCGLRITLKDAASLREITGGWISALYLYLLRYSKDGELARPESIDALLEEEIFSPLPETARGLLLALSPQGHFTTEQAEFLLGENGNATAALADLLRKNSFIAYNKASGVYALHSLFRQYLQERFAELPEAQRLAAHSRCADWFIRQKEATLAIEACYNAREYERALEVLESDMSRNMVTEKPRFFVDLFKACPEDVLDRHMDAAFKYAIAVFTAGEYPAFGGQLAWLSKKCAERVAKNGQDDPTAKAWRGELEFLLSLAAYNDIAAMSDHHRKANALLGRPTQLFGPESPWTLGCPSVLFMFHRQSGKLDEELAHMDECLPHYYALASMHGAGGEQQMRAESLYYRGRFAEAAVACRQAEARAKANGQISVLLCGMGLRLRMALVEGKTEEARALARDMRGAIRERRDFFLLHTVDLCEGLLHVATGNLEQIPDWLRFGAGGEHRLYTFAGGYYYIVHGRVLLLAGEYAAVTGLFAWLLQSGAFKNHLMFSIYAHLYMAAANTALGLKAEAGTSLRTSLDLALPDELYMPFAENADMLPQLKTLSRKKNYRQGVRQILRLALVMGKIPGCETSDNTAQGAPNGLALLALLTGRERELVEHALSGKTYMEIAVALGLAHSRVKRAFIAINKKLGINSREQLAAKFGEQ